MKNNSASSLLVRMLSFLLFACMFFSIYDLVFEKIWWSTVYLYIPFSLIFTWCLYVWRRSKYGQMLIHGVLFLLISLGVNAYGIYLVSNGESLWGLLSCLFTSFTFLISYYNFQYWKINA